MKKQPRIDPHKRLLATRLRAAVQAVTREIREAWKDQRGSWTWQPIVTPSGVAAPPVTILATRTTGVAPLAVVFDVSDYDSTETSQAYFDNDVLWDFDDPGTGNYEYGNQESKDSALGPIAAHTFETDGTYTVSVFVRLPVTGDIVTDTIVITVTDPDTVYSGTSTVAISRTGDFTGAPSGANQVTTTSWATVRSHLNANTRVLLQRGETAWTVDQAHTFGVTNTGGTFGAFGAGAEPQPIINTTTTVFTYAGDDWRIMDLTFVDTTPHGAIFVQDDGSASGNHAENLLFLRCIIQDFNSINQIAHGQDVNAAFTDGTNHGPLYFFECRFLHPFDPGGQTTGQWLCSADNLAVVGCEWQHPADDHFGIRMVWIRRSVFSNNDLYGNQDSAQSPFRLLSIYWDNTNNNYDNLYTEKVVVSGSHMDIEAGANFVVGTVNQQDQRHRHMLIERNFFQCSDATNNQFLWECNSANATGEDSTHFRFNVFSRVSTSTNGFITINQNHVSELQPTGVRVYRNTFFTDDTIATLNALIIQTGIAAGEVSVYSNFIHADNATTINPANDNSAGADIGDNVTANDAASNHFVVAPPVVPSDFALIPTSTGVDAGRTGEPALYRYDGSRIGFGQTADCGAWEGLDVDVTAAMVGPLGVVAAALTTTSTGGTDAFSKGNFGWKF